MNLNQLTVIFNMISIPMKNILTTKQAKNTKNEQVKRKKKEKVKRKKKEKVKRKKNEQVRKKKNEQVKNLPPIIQITNKKISHRKNKVKK